MSQLLEIDGSVLEGGGQILRISLSLSAILGVPIRVTKIRAGRPKPGLAEQHLKGIELVGKMCQARMKGASPRSTEIEFVPGKIRGGQYQAFVKTAGSISLLIQTALPVALLADGTVTLDLRGGTNAEMAPQVDYTKDVFRCILNKFGADFTLDVQKRGYYPKGGGLVKVEVTPVPKLNSVTLTERGDVDTVTGYSFVAGALNVRLANEMAEGARQKLCDTVKNIEIKRHKENKAVAPDTCNGIILKCESSTGCVLGSDCLGHHRVEGLDVGRAAGNSLRDCLNSGACVDPFAQDQLIIYMALAEGKSSIKTGDVTVHTKTAIHVAELIAKTKFTITPSDDGTKTNIIECVGLGFLNKNLPPE